MSVWHVTHQANTICGRKCGVYRYLAEIEPWVVIMFDSKIIVSWEGKGSRYWCYFRLLELFQLFPSNFGYFRLYALGGITFYAELSYQIQVKFENIGFLIIFIIDIIILKKISKLPGMLSKKVGTLQKWLITRKLPATFNTLWKLNI